MTNANESISFLRVDDLKLDPENPRLPESLPRNPKSIIDHIATSTSIEDLMNAIAENDFFPGEPLVVVTTNNANKPLEVQAETLLFIKRQR